MPTDRGWFGLRISLERPCDGARHLRSHLIGDVAVRQVAVIGIPDQRWGEKVTAIIVPVDNATVTEADIIGFAERYDPQFFHTDPAAAKRSMFGGLIASGWHTVAMVMRMMCDSYLLDSASLGSPGVDNVKWLKPVRPGDTIRAMRTVLEARASKSKPEVGIVKSRWEVYNQNDELVMTMEGYGMFAVRDPVDCESRHRQRAQQPVGEHFIVLDQKNTHGFHAAIGQHRGPRGARAPSPPALSFRNEYPGRDAILTMR